MNTNNPPTHNLTEQQMVELLENNNQNRGLKFTSPFEGLIPVQAYGHVDGKRFYYRSRSGTTSLQIGVYDKTVEENRQRNNTDNCYLPDLITENTPELYPSIIHHTIKLTGMPGNSAERFQQLLNALPEY